MDRTSTRQFVFKMFCTVAMQVLAACGGGGSPAAYTIGGTVSGLSGSGLVLQDNGSDTLKISGNGAFTFAMPVMTGKPFDALVSSQPTNPSQTCALAPGSGTVSGGDITNIMVSCTTNTYTLGGVVSGLTGSGLVLINNGVNYAVSTNGPFTFTSAIASGISYGVTVGTEPSNPSQTCTVGNASGAVGAADVASIAVFCAQAVGRFAYVVGSGQETLNLPPTLGTISVFNIDPGSGALTLVPGSAVSTGPLVSSFQFVPHTSFAWALNLGFEYPLVNGFGIGSVYDYSVDSASGLLTPVAGSPFSQLDGTSSTPGCSADPPGSAGSQGQGSTEWITFSPSGPFGFAANVANPPGAGVPAYNDEVWEFTIDPTTGAPSLVAGSSIPEVCSGEPGAVTTDPSGRFVYTGTQTAIYASEVNALTHALTMVPGSPYSIGGYSSIVIDPTGRFAYVLTNQVYAFTIDPSTGALTPVVGSPYAIDAKSMTIDPKGQFAYFTKSDGVYIYSIDSTTGALATLSASASVALNSPSALQIDPSGQFAYSVAYTGGGGGLETGVYAFTVSANTGALSAVSGNPFAPSASAGSPVSITVTN